MTALSIGQRQALRTAILTHPRYAEAKATLGKRASEFTKEELLQTAESFGLDVAAILAGAPAASPSPRPVAADKTDAPATAPGELEAGVSLPTIEAVLEPIAPFVADRLLDELRARMQPIVDRANAPPREVVKTIHVPVPQGASGTVPGQIAQGEPIRVPTAPLASVTGKETCARIFGISTPETRALQLSIWDAQDAPDPDPHFVFEAELLHDVAACIEHGQTVWLAGPAGTGKTSMPREIAARVRRPSVRIAFDRATEAVELLGTKYPQVGGGVRWEDGVLTAAIQRPGTVIILDEPTFARPGTLAVLQTILDHRFVTLKEDGGRVVRCAPGVTFCIADNTAGHGDETGTYADTQPMNRALLDRNAMLLEVTYLPKALEKVALMGITSIPEVAATTLVEFAQLTRRAYANGTMTGGLSIRRLIALANAVLWGVPARRAFRTCIVNLLNKDDRAQVTTLAEAHLNFDALEKQVKGLGEVVTAAPEADNTGTRPLVAPVDPDNV